MLYGIFIRSKGIYICRSQQETYELNITIIKRDQTFVGDFELEGIEKHGRVVQDRHIRHVHCAHDDDDDGELVISQYTQSCTHRTERGPRDPNK